MSSVNLQLRLPQEFWLRELPSFPWKCPFPSVFRQSPTPCRDQSLLFAMQKAKRQPESAGPLRLTTTCFYFARGLCDRGASCTYAHSASDLRPKPDLSRTSLWESRPMHGGEGVHVRPWQGGAAAAKEEADCRKQNHLWEPAGRASRHERAKPRACDSEGVRAQVLR
ncbi:unnamed protein product [Polarella glacialis]|uniref:C3H1-type domain-containing protein n=1 Tax=Polarella glacialis TaxID=89957 RepID=A0A813LN20_POLGL|nr:unnamed protein product [Polarella glacialis]